MRLTFVVPWYGADVTGGAENLARHTAEALRRIGSLDVEVWTTCVRDFRADWNENTRPPGRDEVNGVPVRRFPVRARDASAFAAVNARLMEGGPVSDAQQQVFMREMIHSPALYDAIRQDRDGRVFLFIPYMFGTTFEGAAIHPDRSVLIPCLHDESYAYMTRYAKMFEEVRGVIFLTAAERRLAERLYRMRPGAAAVLGGGIDTDFSFDRERFAKKYGVDNFLLYVGRREPGKNTPLLIHYFNLYKRQHPSDLKLVLIGVGDVDLAPGQDDIIDLGFVSDQDKHDAYAAAMALCQPSHNESFSIVMMEAWACGTPALVLENCDVTRENCLEANGGLFFSDWTEFAEALEWFRQHRAAGRILGGYGRRYVLDHFRWDIIVRKYVDALAKWGFASDQRPSAAVATVPGPLEDLREVHQLVAGFRRGDAISQMALVLQNALRSWALVSEIVGEHVSPDTHGGAWSMSEFAPYAHRSQLLVYHYSIDSAATDLFLRHPGKKLLLYHNITPASFFAGYSDAQLELARTGRERLSTVIRASHLCMGVSPYNCLELEEYGAADPRVLPVLPDLEHLAHTDPDPEVMRRFGRNGSRRGSTILFVGRLSPNKRQDNVIRAFGHYRTVFEPRARLILVGGFGPEKYRRQLRAMVLDMGLTDSVTFADYVDESALAAYYRVADVYLSMSEHEGCGVPLLEAMRFDVPVVAYGAAGVPQTLGDAGVLLPDRDVAAAAAALNRVLRDLDFRDTIIHHQRRRLRDFAPAKVTAMLQCYIEEVLNT